AHCIQQRAPSFRRRGDVEEHDLIRALGFVALRQFHRISHVAQIREADALHDAAILHIEADDYALAEHYAFSSSMICTLPFVLNTAPSGVSACLSASPTAFTAASTMW